MSEHYFSKKPQSTPKFGLIKCNLRGHSFEFITSSGVFSFKRIDSGTRILIDSMIIPKTGFLLDLGCGYGPIGIAAARSNPNIEVFMTDINERAIFLAEKNAKRNRVDNVNILKGFLYEPVKNISFDAIVTNPPISAGLKKVVKPIIEGAFSKIKPMGCLQLVVQWNKGGKTISSLLEKQFKNVEVLSKESGYRVLKSNKNALSN